MTATPTANAPTLEDVLNEVRAIREALCESGKFPEMRLLTITDIAKAIGKTRGTTRSYLKQARLYAGEHGRYDASVIEQLRFKLTQPRIRISKPRKPKK